MNACLEVVTTKKAAFIAGKEFGECTGHTLLTCEAQNGLKSSGKCWHDKPCNVLDAAGFFSLKGDKDVWMKDCRVHCECMAVCAHDLPNASKNFQWIVNCFTCKEVNFKLKGTGEVRVHLGCDHFKDKDSASSKCSTHAHECLGRSPSMNMQSPLEKNDNSKLDDSDPLDVNGIAKCQPILDRDPTVDNHPGQIQNDHQSLRDECVELQSGTL